MRIDLKLDGATVEVDYWIRGRVVTIWGVWIDGDLVGDHVFTRDQLDDWRRSIVQAHEQERPYEGYEEE